ncbi:MAG TPA: polymer-forming cytoskeletal protein [Candidatus Sulfotelmatobacter sp.]|nr:polymer-forming cytoskeletal protein [Candidatus Sulfotelmatobacter sp.]
MALFDKKRHESSEWTGFLEKGVKLEGKLEFPGTFRLDCVMKGTLSSSETLILGEHAVVEGQIYANYVAIAGRFDGVIEAKGRVEIRTKAIVTGEIHTPCLVIEPGAVFDGRCHMLAASQAAKPLTIPIRSAAHA